MEFCLKMSLMVMEGKERERKEGKGREGKG